jgi:hypothetical protein
VFGVVCIQRMDVRIVGDDWTHLVSTAVRSAVVVIPLVPLPPPPPIAPADGVIVAAGPGPAAQIPYDDMPRERLVEELHKRDVVARGLRRLLEQTRVGGGEQWTP